MLSVILRSFLLCLVVAGWCLSICATPRIRVIKLAITNPTDQSRPAENIILSIADLKRIAPD